MEIIKASTDWAKGEVFSSIFFIISGLTFIGMSIGFWQLGKSEVAKAYIYPALVTGSLLLIIGVGIFYANKVRETSFVEDYNLDAPAFVEAELARTEQSLNEYKTIVFKVIPGIIIIASLLIVFVSTPTWRAISIMTLAMMVVILLVDSNAKARIENYRSHLTQHQSNN